MTTLFGHLGIADSDRAFLRTLGRTVVAETVAEYVDRINTDLAGQMRLFVERTTEDVQIRYKLPGGGLMQRGPFTATPAAAVRTTGTWDVAFPLWNSFDDIDVDYISEAYMSAADFQYQLDGLVARNINTVRNDVLRRMFNNTQWSFTDPHNGTLLIQPLANGDAVLFPPVIGSAVEATENHYLESGYAANAISNINNPFPVMVAELTEHFGNPTGGSNIIVLMNVAQVPLVRALAEFTQVDQRFVMAGDDTDLATNLPPVPTTARVLGYGYDCWMVQWDYIPANYMIAIHQDAPKPLFMRVDPADTGIPSGLHFRDEETLQGKRWRAINRYGFGTANRLNGVVMEFGVGGGYTIPAAFA